MADGTINGKVMRIILPDRFERYYQLRQKIY